MHYYQRHIGDYAKDTGHLTLLEHGAYTVLLDWAYASEKPLAKDHEELYRLCRAVRDEEKQAVDRVLLQFFPRGRNKRVVQEIHDWRVKSRNNKKSAAVRWQKKRNANASQTHSDGSTTRARVPPTTNQDPLTNQPAGEEGFAEVPSFAEIQAFAAQYPGEPASGTPPIDSRWVPSVMLKLDARREPPRNWRRWVVSVWRAEWREFQKKPAALQQKQTPGGRERGEILQELEIARKTGAPREELDRLETELKNL
jgi:uncharacterized protein YdaU (DUF1376 family)